MHWKVSLCIDMKVMPKIKTAVGLLGLFFFLLPVITPSPEVFASVKKKSKQEKPQILPEFPKQLPWINSRALDKRFFEDKLTLLYVWDYTSINCIREFKILKTIQEQYRPYRFQILWMHAPELNAGKEMKHVQDAVKRFGLKGPVFLDNDFKVWESLKLRAWPSKVLINDKRKVLSTRSGEGRYSDLEASIRMALKELDPNMVLPPTLYKENLEAYSSDMCGRMSGETYLGFKKSNLWGAKAQNRQYLPPNETLIFKDQGERSERGFFVEGNWTNKEEYLEHARETGTLYDYAGILYQGREVYAVLQSTNPHQNARVYVTRDGQPVPEGYRGEDIVVDEKGDTYVVPNLPRLYYLIEGEDEEYHELKLWTASKHVAISSFSFSNLCLADFEHQ